MTLKEAYLSGKKFRRKRTSFGPAYGTLMEGCDNVLFIYKQRENPHGVNVSMPLNVEDVLADDWEIEQLPKTYWLGMYRLDLYPERTIRCLEAVEGENCPTYLTADGKPWIKVVEEI